jgi:hypothetical protein
MRALILAVFTTIFLFQAPVWALDVLQTGAMIKFASSIQEAIDKGNYVFVGVIVLMLVIQFLKATCGRKFPSVKKHAAQYSALGGALAGGAVAQSVNADPIAGAVGGLITGNAASGLYSSFVKPLLSGLGNVFPAAMLAVPVFGLVYKAVAKSKNEKRKEVTESFNKAIEQVNSDNPNTKDLEKWFAKNL